MAEALIALSGRRQGARYPLIGDMVLLGRSPGADVVIEDESASREHAEIRRRGSEFYVRDLGSKNGTFVNDQRVTEAVIKPGDKLTLGLVTYILQTTTSQRIETSIKFKDGAAEDVTSTIKLSQTQVVPSVSDHRAAEHFESLYHFMTQVYSLLDDKRVVEEALELVFKSVNADRGFIMMLDDNRELKPTAVRLRDTGFSKDISVSKTMTEYVMEQGESLLSSDTASDRRFKKSSSIHAFDVSSVVVAPVKSQDRIIGLMYVDTVRGSLPLTEQDLWLVSSMAVLTGTAIANAKLYSSLMDATKFASSVLRSLISGLLVVDSDGTITKVNDAALKIVKLHEYDLLGKKLSDFKNLRPLSRLLAETISTGQPHDRDEIVITVGMESVPLGISTSPLIDHEGKIAGGVANFRSLTLVKMLSEQVKMSQHLATIGEMAAGVAHEIRNPLNAIRGFAQLIEEGPPKDTLEEYSTYIIEEVDRMNRMVGDLLDLARARQPTVQSIDVQKLVMMHLRDLTQRVAGTGVNVETEIDEGLPAILGNPDKLLQVFNNISQNAVDAMTPGGGTLTIRASHLAVTAKPREAEGSGRDKETPPQNGDIRIVFSDTGAGISSDIIGKVFNPFFTMKDSGTGLGLAICRKILELHHGRIEVESEPGEGTRFTIMLPVHAEE